MLLLDRRIRHCHANFAKNGLDIARSDALGMARAERRLLSAQLLPPGSRESEGHRHSCAKRERCRLCALIMEKKETP